MRDDCALHRLGLLGGDIRPQVDGTATIEVRPAIGVGVGDTSVTMSVERNLHAIGAHRLTVVVGRPESKGQRNGGSRNHVATVPEELHPSQ